VTQGKVVCHGNESSCHATTTQTSHTDSHRDHRVRIERERRNHADCTLTARSADRYTFRSKTSP
jgi:hypothetical protein